MMFVICWYEWHWTYEDSDPVTQTGSLSGNYGEQFQQIGAQKQKPKLVSVFHSVFTTLARSYTLV